MSTYGFSVSGSDGKVLVDADVLHPHFIGKFSHYTKVNVPDLLQGPGWKQHGPNDNKSNENLPNVGTIFKFKIEKSGSFDDQPMCFIKPSSVTSSAPLQGIVKMSKESNHWDVWVLSSADHSTAPKIYAFAPIRSVKQHSTVWNDAKDVTHGLKTMTSSGMTSFDSRYKPLRVVANGSIDSPTAAHTGSSGSGRTVNLGVNSTQKSIRVSAADSFASNDILYYAPSIAHACHQYEWAGSGSGWHSFKRYKWSRIDLWWCFYRMGYRVYKSSGKMYMRGNYGVYARGHIYDHVTSTSSILGSLVAIVLTGGAALALLVAAVADAGLFDKAAVASGGYLPYENGSRNTESINFVLTRASYYD